MYPAAIQVINACWLIFVFVWVVAAGMTKRSIYNENIIQRLRYIIILAAGCFLLFRGNRLAYPLSQRVIPATNTIASPAAILCTLGLLFCLWARVTLGKNWSGTVTVKENHKLIVRGPYRLVRHPIYTGLITMVVATALIMGHLAAAIGVLLGFLSFWIKLTKEEAVMLQQFPDQYSAYHQRVKRIIPFTL
jgi:protein-S-isoprenylcysteine O-methyltransferase Ste14